MTIGRYEENANSSAGENRTQLVRELAVFAEQTSGRTVSPADLQLLEEWLDIYSAEEIRTALRESVRHMPRQLFRYTNIVLANHMRRTDADHRRSAPHRQDTARDQLASRRDPGSGERRNKDENGRYLTGPFRGMTRSELINSLYEN